jgi:NAD-dependent dihydropyrimidine dehydrogenase PreA subunit
VHQGLTAVVACHARTVRWLCHRAGATLPQDTACLNLRTQPAADVIAALGLQPAAETGAPPDPPSARDWPPWYPVIDYDRCTNCKQCLQFCLFGTYETDADDRVTVAQPQNCKNNCPACARICPATAIIFPKLDEEPLNGAEVVDEQAQRDRAHSSMQQILGSDPYQALRARQQRAGRLVDRQKLERARQERERCRREHGDDEG